MIPPPIAAPAAPVSTTSNPSPDGDHDAPSSSGDFAALLALMAGMMPAPSPEDRPVPEATGATGSAEEPPSSPSQRMPPALPLIAPCPPPVTAGTGTGVAPGAATGPVPEAPHRSGASLVTGPGVMIEGSGARRPSPANAPTAGPPPAPATPPVPGGPPAPTTPPLPGGPPDPATPAISAEPGTPPARFSARVAENRAAWATVPSASTASETTAPRASALGAPSRQPDERSEVFPDEGLASAGLASAGPGPGPGPSPGPAPGSSPGPKPIENGRRSDRAQDDDGSAPGPHTLTGAVSGASAGGTLPTAESAAAPVRPGAKAVAAAGPSLPATPFPAPVRAEATSAAAATGSTPALPPTVADQIVSAVVPLHGRGDGRHEVTLELRPDHLGAIRVEVSVEHQTVHVTLHAADAATGRLLSAALGDLRAALAEAGLTAGHVGVGPGGGGEAGHRRPSPPDDGTGRGTARPGNAAGAERADPVRTVRPAGAGRLDLLL